MFFKPSQLLKEPSTYIASMKQLTILLTLVLSFATLSSYAQITTTPTDSNKKEYYLIKKADGAEFIGEVLSDDGREVLLLTKNIGKIYITKSDITSMERIDASKLVSTKEVEYQDYRVEGPYTTRYFFTTNALPIKKKENYMMIGLQGPEVHFAVNDNLSLGVMATWIASPIAIAAKYSFNAKPESKTHFALGTIIASSGYLLNAQGFGGIHWATVTQGTRKSNVSFSAGYAYANLGDWGNGVGRKYGIVDNSNDYQKRYGIQSSLANRDIDIYADVLSNNTRGSFVIGLSGITPIGKKSSFIFDAMAFVGKRYGRRQTSDLTINNLEYTYYDYGTYITETSDVTLNQYEAFKVGNRTTLILMPAMRFNQSYNKAFQVALAGVIVANGDGYPLTFPVPMISWLRQF